MASKQMVCVRLLSGAIVYEGLRPQSLSELQNKVAATLGIHCADELVFCKGETVLDYINDTSDTDEQIIVVRDQVMGLLEEFMLHVLHSKLPAHLWPAENHRRLMLAAVKRDGRALLHASIDLRADRDVVLAAVESRSCMIKCASPDLRNDRDFVLLAMERNGYALSNVPAEFRADKDVVLFAVAQNGLALQFASDELRAHNYVVLFAVKNDARALRYASPELQADRDFAVKAVTCNRKALLYLSDKLRGDPGVRMTPPL